MKSSAAGKVAFVTGGASGIGSALAAKLVGGGAEVWIADRQAGPAEELAQRLNETGGKAHAIELDVPVSDHFRVRPLKRSSSPDGSTSSSTMPVSLSPGRSTR